MFCHPAMSKDASHESDHDRADLKAFQRAGDRDALDRLWRRHCDESWRLAHSICGAAADDALQEAALKVVRHAGSWKDRGPGSATAWLMSVVANAARDQRRRAAVLQRRLPLAAAARVDPRSGQPSTATQPVEVVHRTLANLSSKYRRAIELRYLAGLDFPALAAALGVPERTARTHVSRGIQQLRKRLGLDSTAAVVIAIAPASLPAAPTGCAHLVASGMLQSMGESGTTLIAASHAVPSASVATGIGLTTWATATLCVTGLMLAAWMAVTGADPQAFQPLQPRQTAASADSAAEAATSGEEDGPAAIDWLSERCAPWPAWPGWEHPQMLAVWLRHGMHDRHPDRHLPIRAPGFLRLATRPPNQPPSIDRHWDAHPTVREQLDSWATASGGTWQQREDGTIELSRPLPVEEKHKLLEDLRGPDDLAGRWAARRLLADGDGAAARAAIADLNKAGEAADRIRACLLEAVVQDRQIRLHLDNWQWWANQPVIHQAIDGALDHADGYDRLDLLTIAGRLGMPTVADELLSLADDPELTYPHRYRVHLALHAVHTPASHAWLVDHWRTAPVHWLQMLEHMPIHPNLHDTLQSIAADPSVDKKNADHARIRQRYMRQLHPPAPDLGELANHPKRTLKQHQLLGGYSYFHLPPSDMLRARSWWLAWSEPAQRDALFDAWLGHFTGPAEANRHLLGIAATFGHEPTRSALLSWRPERAGNARQWATALGIWGDTRAWQTLADFINDAHTEPALRAAALEGLRAFTIDRLGAETLEGAPFWRMVTGPLLHDESPPVPPVVKLAAAEVLGDIGTVPDPDLAAIHRRVVDTKPGIGNSKADQHLRFAARIPDRRSSLGALGAPRYLDQMGKAIAENSDQVAQLVPDVYWFIVFNPRHRQKATELFLALAENDHPLVHVQIERWIQAAQQSTFADIRQWHEQVGHVHGRNKRQSSQTQDPVPGDVRF